jgi:hypothetical protein
MIATPPGWRIVDRFDRLELEHPRGRDVAMIEYRERLRPLRKVGALLREALAGAPDFTPAALPDSVERTVTDEGEYGALATVRGTARGHSVQRDVGFLFGDDFYARISAVCHDPALCSQITELVRELVTTDVHALGIRRRRFDYAPPRTWQPLARAFVTDWLAPGYPRDPVSLTAYAAIPLPLLPPQFLRALLGGDQAQLTNERVASVALANGLTGEIAEATSAVGERRVEKVCCLLRDGRFAYVLDATAVGESRIARHRDVLAGVFASVQPIPNPCDELRTRAGVAAHAFWTE